MKFFTATPARWLGFLPFAAMAACTDTPATPADASVADISSDISTADTPPVDNGVPASNPEDCDPLNEEVCAMPWPSNLYLRPTPSRPTGYALNFGPTSLPRNDRGDLIDATQSLAFMDGYGLGTPIMVMFPNLDASMLPNEENIERSMAADARIMLFKVTGTSLTRVPYFTELDSQEADPAKKTLFIRPAVILEEATRYVVALRNLRTTSGSAVPASRAFALLRDDMGSTDPRLAPRQQRFNEMFRLLESASVTRQSLTLAWDFNTASSQALHGRMLAMRDDALTRVGPMGPALRINQVRTFSRTADAGVEVNEHIAVELIGTMEVPDYTVSRTYPGIGTNIREFNLDESGRPMAMGVATVPFWVRIPHSAIGGEPHGVVVYGHGLLGSGEEVRAGHLGRLANTQRFILVSASLAGMNEDDISTVFTALGDLTYFRAVGQRLHQGIIQWVLLARAARERLGALPELMSRNVRVNRNELYYSGNSQGGIFGGTFMAVTPDITRGHLGVPGNNYSTILHRSTDFVSYFTVLRMRYVVSTDQAVALAYVQLQWDGADSVNYLRRITAQPFMGNTPHHVLVGPAKGDYQVSVFTNEIAARTDIGIPLMANYDRDRSPWNCPQAMYPRTGSGVVLYDFGNPWPPPGNRPPRVEMPGDPHGRPRAHPAHQTQIANFFRTGVISDVCGGDGCHPD